MDAMQVPVRRRPPCQGQAEALRAAIDEWVAASESTRAFMVKLPLDPSETLEPLQPGFFQDMQEAYERERLARERCLIANNALYECMIRHGLID
jgi:hypothetical protein